MNTFEGHPLQHVTVDADGDYWLRSRLTGNMHYVPQTRDTIVDAGKTHPTSGDPIFSVKASYAMGRADGNPNTGMGPQQTGGVTAGFSHTDDMSCVACHASWTNTCMGCHLEGEYNNKGYLAAIEAYKRVLRSLESQDEASRLEYGSRVHFRLGECHDGRTERGEAGFRQLLYLPP